MADYETEFFGVILIMLLIFVFGGIFGFLYETLFYKIDLGYFVKRGSTFGPWIPIYGMGGILMALITYHFKKNPLIVFLLATLISGLLEFGTGYILYHIFNTRLWDYNTEIWNLGNIGGYICLRSVLFFGISGLLLIYAVIPIIKILSKKIPKKIFATISIIPAALFIIDIWIYRILHW
jgi:uncharacterized membrane protein